MQLIAEQLVIDRGDRTIIDKVSFAVSSGEAMLLTGPNGAGKTTLLRCLAGFLPLTSGTVKLDGGDPDKSIGEQAHVIGHASAVKPTLSVRENVDFWARYLMDDDVVEERVAAALTHFQLNDLEHYPAGYLSAGQKRRLGLARLFAAKRPIWLLDEPTVSLDTISVGLLATAVNNHTHNGGIVIAATHLPLGIERTKELQLTPYSATIDRREGMHL